MLWTIYLICQSHVMFYFSGLRTLVNGLAYSILLGLVYWYTVFGDSFFHSFVSACSISSIESLFLMTAAQRSQDLWSKISWFVLLGFVVCFPPSSRVPPWWISSCLTASPHQKYDVKNVCWSFSDCEQPASSNHWCHCTLIHFHTGFSFKLWFYTMMKYDLYHKIK